jgi:hypothetical protein
VECGGWERNGVFGALELADMMSSEADLTEGTGLRWVVRQA